MYINKEHKKIVEDRRYIYVGSYNRNEITIDNRNINKNKVHIRIKCPYCKKEYDIDIYTFKNGANCKYCCNKYENSFAYHIEVELNEPLDNYWDWNKNELNPYHIYKSSKQKIWIKCQNKNYHIYETTCNKFHQKRRCPYCDSFASHKVHPFDSFGALYPKKAKYWSNKNKVSTYDVSIFSHKEYWFICEKCYRPFKRRLNNINNRGDSLNCVNCVCSKGEQRINEWLKNNSINFIPQKTFNNLVGLNNGNLSYDFYLPDYNLLIEYQGEQHEHFVKGFQKSIKNFEKQLEHDRRKRQYAINNNIELLEIWYWDYDNIENILSNKL